MATINLGRIKPVFQGAFNVSTAYVVDDIVTFGGETFICILASTGNATSDATYWSKLAKKGDDVSQLTTHGDFLFRGASGVERLPAGTSGQVLQTRGAGQDPQFADATSINWDYRNTSFTAVSGGAYIANTGENGAFTITLPANPSDNDYVLIADGYGSWKDANLTVGRNGQNIAGEAADLTADTNYATLRLTYKTTPDVTSSYIGWVLT
jgi:hypothetical protein